ncbi:extensin family protein [Methylocella sp.]|uniref:extensin family protein n=1 Tax=Methylocella sp. TaxID=1978226 RepID=UPI0037852205
MTGGGDRRKGRSAGPALALALTFACAFAPAGAAQDAGAPPLPPRRPPEAPQAPAPEAAPQPPPKPGPAPAAEPAAQAPQPDAPATRGPAQSSACRAALAALGAHVRPAPAMTPADPRCVMDDPLSLDSVEALDGGRIEFPDAPTLDCAAAEVFARFVAEALAPLAAGALEAPLASVSTGPGYVCRPRDNALGAKLSAHGRGLAVDVAALRLRGGRTYEVGRLADERERALDRAARAAGCGYFNTALGPGADSFHASHWHFDVEPRGAGGKAKFCQ